MLILVLLDQSAPFILFVLLPHIELISVYDVFC